jgi:hypothetical protein
MNLLQIRTKFRQLSGRFDLVTPAYADSGADFLIKAGQDFLDRVGPFSKAVGRYFYTIPLGFNKVIFGRCRAINEVWAATTDARWQLEKISIQDFRDAYPEVPSALSPGAPLVYTPAYLRMVPDPSQVPVAIPGGYIGYADVMFAGDHLYNGVLIGPPVDQQMMIEVWGLFYSTELLADTDESFWTVAHPDTLLYAAFYKMEVFNRNTQGAKDWLNAINADSMGIDKDIVEEEISGISAMEG